MADDIHDECRFMQQLILFNHCKVCVEVGVRGARTTHYMCHAAKINGGHVYGFDIWAAHGLKKQFSSPQGCSQQVAEQFLKQKKHTNFTLSTVDTTTQAFKDLLDAQCPKIDFAFIDACHSYLGVKNDFDAIYPRLTPTGIIAFHDTMRIDGCREFILDLRTRYYDGTYDIIDFPWGFGNRRCGLSILVKRQYQAIKLPLDEKCGSLSSPEEIIRRETQWFKEEKEKNIPEQVNASTLLNVINIDNLGKLPTK